MSIPQKANYSWKPCPPTSSRCWRSLPMHSSWPRGGPALLHPIPLALLQRVSHVTPANHQYC